MLPGSVVKKFQRTRKNMQKTLAVKTVVLLLLALPLSVAAQNNVIDEIVWVVGEEPILKSDVEEARLDAQSNGRRFDGDPFCVIPEELALQKLYLHQAAIDSIEVTDSEVLREVERRIDYLTQMAGSKEKLEEYFGKTTTQIRDRMTESVKEMMLAQKVQSNLVKNIKVTPAQVRNYFKNVPEDSVPFIPTQLEVEILVRNPIVAQSEIDRVKDELRQFTDRVNSGESQFSTLALLYSEDRESAARGGETKFFTRGEMSPEFAAVAFNLTDPKTVSKIVEDEYGFHILQLIEKRGDRVNVRQILLKPRVTDEELTACISQMDSIIDGVKNGDYTFETAVSLASDDKETRANNGLMIYTPDDDRYMRTAKFELKNLPSEVAKVVANMEVGEISKPFVMVNKKNKEVVATVKLKSRTNGHRATVKDDYQALQDVLVSKLSQEKIDQWIRETQKTTYISISDDWKNCEFKYPGWVK